jgi:hypothetical protein
MVFGVMEGWMEEQLRGQVAASAAKGDEKEAIRWQRLWVVTAVALQCVA